MKLLRSCAILALVFAVGCGGSNKPAEVSKTAESMKKEVPKTEAKPAQPTQWKVTGDTVTTASGLKYVVMSEGSGDIAKKGDRVIVHTSGWFLDGSKFYSTYDDGNPLDFPLGATPPRVIAGWEEALIMMKKGGKWQLIVPAKLAYGEQGRPGAIPPNSTLVFDVELMSIEPGK